MFRTLTRAMLCCVCLLAAAAEAGPRKSASKKQPAAREQPAPELAPLVEPTPQPQTQVKKLEAISDTPPPPPPMVEAEPKSEPVEASGHGGATLLLGVRAGGALPLSFLKPGYLAGLEAQYRLPLLDGRLRAGLFAGRTESGGKDARIVPGRGYDPAFIENVVSYPVELALHGELYRDEAQALTVGAGYSALFSRAEFQAVGSQSASSSIGHAALAQLAYRRTLGPGEAAFALQGRFGGASFGTLGQVGTQSLSAIEASLSWAIAVLP